MKLIFTFFTLLFCINYTTAQVGINANGSAPATSAMLDVSSTSKGFLPPRMNTAQRTVITSPTAGLIVFDTDKNQLFVYSNSTWNAIAAPTYLRLSTEDIDALLSPQIGDLAYDLTFKCLKQYNGIRWLCTNQDADNIKPTITAWSAGGAMLDQGSAVAVDGSGNIYITGSFQGTATFGTTNITSSGSSDIFIAKYNNAGILQWVQKAGGNGSDSGVSLTIDAIGDVYIMGLFMNTATFGATNIISSGGFDVFIAKYNSLGIVQWVQKGGGSTDDFGNSLAIDNLGNLYLIGDFQGTATFGGTSIVSSGYSDIFLAKYNNSGTIQWVQKGGGIYSDYGKAVVVDASGNCYITGSFSDVASFSSNNVTSTGQSDVFIAKYNNAGTLQFIKREGGASGEQAISIAVDASGNIYIAGTFSGTTTFGFSTITAAGSNDIFVAKYGSLGNFVWLQNGGGSYSDSAKSLALDNSGNVYVTGNFEVASIFNGNTIISKGELDIFVIKYDTGGIFQWIQRLGGNYIDSPTSIIVSSSGNIFLTGLYNNTVNFGGTILTSSSVNNSDIFIARLKE
jgi:hypothetical protein